MAFQILRATQTKPDQAFVSEGIGFFLKSLDRAAGHWRIILCSAEQSPHAPWWNQTGRENVFDCFSLNPTAEILGYLYDYQELVSIDVLSSLSDPILSHLSGLEKMFVIA